MTTQIVVWYCEKCGYWQKQRGSGIHLAATPDTTPRSAYTRHPLTATTFEKIGAKT